MSSPGNEHDVKVEYVNMGPEQLSLCFLANDTQLVVAADLRDWIAAVGSEQALLMTPRMRGPCGPRRGE